MAENSSWGILGLQVWDIGPLRVTIGFGAMGEMG